MARDSTSERKNSLPVRAQNFYNFVSCVIKLWRFMAAKLRFKRAKHRFALWFCTVILGLISCNSDSTSWQKEDYRIPTRNKEIKVIPWTTTADREAEVDQNGLLRWKIL